MNINTVQEDNNRLAAYKHRQATDGYVAKAYPNTPQGLSDEIARKRGGKITPEYFSRRLTHWLADKTIQDISETISKARVWRCLSPLDAIIVRRINEAVQDGGLAAGNVLLDRLLGKPAQAITGADGEPLMPMIDVVDIARRTAFLLSLAADRGVSLAADLGANDVATIDQVAMIDQDGG